MEIKITSLKAARIIAPMSDFRDRLNSVLISKDGYVGATDGVSALVIEDDILKRVLPDVNILIPSYVVDRVLRMVRVKDKKAETVFLFKQQNSSAYEFWYASQCLCMFIPMDDIAVDIKQHIPPHCELTQCSLSDFDYRQLAKFMDVYRVLQGGKWKTHYIHVQPHGSRPARIEFPTAKQACGATMPVRW